MIKVNKTLNTSSRAVMSDKIRTSYDILLHYNGLCNFEFHTGDISEVVNGWCLVFQLMWVKSFTHLPGFSDKK